MLYLDYSRPAGGWIPNKYGGRENLEAIDFLRRFNTEVFARFPQATTAAEESTAWPQVSRPVEYGGLGFGYKWNMGWMHDTLNYISKDPIHRKHHHGDILFGLHYAFSENFILPLSHDEVVHGKRSILGRMPGDEWQRFANLRAYYGFMFGHPGKKLMFMGCEFGQEREWNHDHSLDWHLLEQKNHAGIQSLIRDLNRLYRTLPALHELDCEPAGFEWVVTDDADGNVFAWMRKGNDARARCLVVVNFSPNVYHNYRVRVPFAGNWREVLNSDSAHYGGSNVGNVGEVQTLRRLRARTQSHHPAAGCDLPRTGKLSMRLSAGTSVTPRRKLGRPGHQLCAVLGQCGEGRALPVRQPGPPRARAHRAAGAHRRRLARLSQRRLARPALRLSRPRPLRARARPPLQSPTSCCSIPMPGGSPAGWCGAMRISAIAPAARARTCRSTAATMRAACRRRSWSTRPSTGAAARSRPNIPWEDTIIYEAHVKGLTQKREDVPPDLRGTYGGLSLAGDDRSSQAARRHHDRAAADPRASSTTACWSRRSSSNYWGYNTLRLLRAGAALRARTTRSTRSAPRWRGCTMPASR